MKSSLKWLAIASLAGLLTACETAPGDSSNTGSSGMDGRGGMQGVVPGTNSDPTANVGDRVFFALDSSTLSSEAQQTLERQAAWLQQYSNLSITVGGHADERGTREYNLALGERRANAAKKYLVSLGVNAGRISTISYGKERPAVIGSNEAAWGQNRRAVTVVGN